MSAATGNFTAAGTWGLVDATSYNNTETTTTALTTAFQESTGATTGVITVAGVAVKLAVRTGTTGTMSVHLAIATVEVPGTLVTINTADLPAAVTANADGGWVFFKFASPVILAGATSYTVGAKTSSAAQISLRSTATTNWARALRTTATGAPAAGDDMIVVGEYTGAGTSNTLTVTMNNTATTDFGSNTNSTVTPALALGSKGVLTWGTTASTNYYLKLSGNFIQYLDSAYNMGTVATPMPATSTGVLEFDPAADGDMGYIQRGGTSIAQGAAKTLKTMLTADVAAAGTVLTLGSTAGWLATDVLGIASTTRTASECESKIILTVDSTTQVTLTAGVTNAHSGTGATAGEVINTTCNLKIRSATSTIMAYVLFGGTATMAPTANWDYVEIYYIGENATGKKGIEITIAGSTVDVSNCSIHDTEDGALNMVTSGTPNCSGLVFYNISTTSLIAGITIATGGTLNSSTIITTGTNLSGLNGVSITSAAAVITNNTIVGCSAVTGSVGAGFNYNVNALTTGTFSGNIAHSNANIGFILQGGTSSRRTVTNCTAWRNNNTGGFNFGDCEDTTMTGCVAFGNVGYGMGTNSSGWLTGVLEIINFTSNGGTTLVQTNGLNFTGNAYGSIMIFDSSFGATTAHATSDIATGIVPCALFRTVLATSTEVTTPTLDSYSVWSHENDNSSTTFKSTYRFGTILNDTTTRHTASGYSWKLTPTSATNKLILPGPLRYNTSKVAVNASTLITLSIWVNYDGSYNGNMPRLVLVGGIVSGVGSAGTNVVATAATSMANTWQQLTVTATPSEAGVVEWYADCDGTAGNAYFQDFTPSQA